MWHPSHHFKWHTSLTKIHKKGNYGCSSMNHYGIIVNWVHSLQLLLISTVTTRIFELWSGTNLCYPTNWMVFVLWEDQNDSIPPSQPHANIIPSCKYHPIVQIILSSIMAIYPKQLTWHHSILEAGDMQEATRQKIYLTLNNNTKDMSVMVMSETC